MIQKKIYQWAKTQPSRQAVIWNTISLDYASFANTIEVVRQRLKGEQPGRDGTAVVLGRNLLPVWINVIALRALGVTTVSVITLNQAVSLELNNVVWVVVASTEDLNGGELGDIPFGDAKLTWSLPTINRSQQLLAIPQESFSVSGGHILYTSGTTGTNKKVLLPAEHEDLRNEARIVSMGLNRDTIYYGSSIPIGTSAGYKTPLSVWHAGGSVVFEQPTAYKNLLDLDITHAFLVPAFLRNLLHHVERAKPFSKRQFTLMTGGSFLALDLAERIKLVLTETLIIGYFSTECAAGPLMSSKYVSKDDLHWLTPDADRSIQVVNEKGEQCADGEEGRLRIESKATDCHAYMDDPKASAEVFRHGYFYPGDLAIRRSDGRIRVIGRIADVVNLQGFKVAVAPLEQWIQDTLKVEEVCVFAGMSDAGKDELVVAVQSKDKLIDADLQDRVRAAILASLPKIVSFEHIRIFTFPQFPRDEVGMRKTQRAVLRKKIFDQIDSMT